MITEILVIPTSVLKPFIVKIETYALEPKEYVKLLNTKGGIYSDILKQKVDGKYYLLDQIKKYEIKRKK